SRRRHTRFSRDWSSDVCSSDLRRITSSSSLSSSNPLEVPLIRVEQPPRLSRNRRSRSVTSPLFDQEQSQNVISRSFVSDAVDVKIGRASCRERVQIWMVDVRVE